MYFSRTSQSGGCEPLLWPETPKGPSWKSLVLTLYKLGPVESPWSPNLTTLAGNPSHPGFSEATIRCTMTFTQFELLKLRLRWTGHFPPLESWKWVKKMEVSPVLTWRLRHSKVWVAAADTPTLSEPALGSWDPRSVFCGRCLLMEDSVVSRSLTPEAAGWILNETSCLEKSDL